MGTLLHECDKGSLYIEYAPLDLHSDHHVSIMVKNRHSVICRVNRSGSNLDVLEIHPIHAYDIETLIIALKLLQDLKHYVLEYMGANDG